MTARAIGEGLTAWAGLIGAPAVWAVMAELAQILPYGDCAARTHWTGLSSLAAALPAAGVTWLSWRFAGSSRVLRFASRVSAGAGTLFVLVLLLQGVAGLMLSGCER